VISENIIKAFDGTIGVESSYGKGSKFAFSIVLGKHFEDIPAPFKKQTETSVVTDIHKNFKVPT